MKRKEIVLVVLLIAFGILYEIYESGDIHFYDGCSFDSRKVWGSFHFNYDQETLPFDDISALEIINKAGSIKIRRSETGKTLVKPSIRVYRKNRERADEIRSRLDIETKNVDGRVKIKVDSRGDFPYRRVRVHFDVEAPEGLELALNNRYGDVDLKETGKNVSIDQRYGDLHVDSLASDLRISHGYGKVTVKDVAGDVEVDTKYSKLDLDNARAVKIGGKHTKMKVTNVKGGLQVKNSHQSIGIKNVGGDINLDAKHCQIELADTASGYIIIKNSYKDILLDNIKPTTWTS